MVFRTLKTKRQGNKAVSVFLVLSWLKDGFANHNSFAQRLECTSPLHGIKVQSIFEADRIGGEPSAKLVMVEAMFEKGQFCDFTAVGEIPRF